MARKKRATPGRRGFKKCSHCGRQIASRSRVCKFCDTEQALRGKSATAQSSASTATIPDNHAVATINLFALSKTLKRRSIAEVYAESELSYEAVANLKNERDLKSYQQAIEYRAIIDAAGGPEQAQRILDAVAAAGIRS